MNRNRRSILLLTLSIFILVALFLLSLSLGSAQLSFGDMIFGLILKEGYEKQTLIIYSLRLPRILAAILAGAALSSAGLMLQQATGNDLCAPNIIGVNAGAGLFVMLVLCFMPSFYYILPLSAFVGALSATVTVLFISHVSGSSSSRATLVLAGVAVGAFFNAGISFLSYVFPDVLISYTAFTSGSLSGIYMEDIYIPSVAICVCLTLSLLIAPRLKLLCLGDGMASSLGVNVKAVRVSAIMLASALCASVVSFAGLIGFVGLIVPHTVRKLMHTDSPLLLPSCMTVGASLLLLSDLLGRTLFAPSELPCGIITSFIGAPFFIMLLFGRRSHRA